MPISLPPELEEFANHQLDSGRYASIEEMLVAGLRALAAQNGLETMEMGDFDAAGVFQTRSEDEMIQQSLVALEEYRRTGRSISHDAMKQWASELGN
jgi:Arc/MetJ-type ribon-helix-helix transcriptional regulator